MRAHLIAFGLVVACSGKSSHEKPVQHGPRTQITYEIDLDVAVGDRAAALGRDLEAAFATQKIAATVHGSAGAPGGLTILPTEAAAKPAIQQLMQASYRDIVVERECAAAAGPSAICVAISAAHAQAVKQAALTAAVGTVRARLVALGIAEPNVFAKAGDIVVELPGTDAERNADIRSVIARAGKLEMKVVDDGAPFMKELFAHVGMDRAGQPTDPRAVTDEIRVDIDQWRGDEGPLHQDFALIAHDREVEGRRLTGRMIIEKYLDDASTADPRFRIPDDRQIAYEVVEPQPDAKDQRPYWRTYFVERGARLTGAAIAKAAGTTDPNTGRPIVLLDFNRAGAEAFGDLTASIVGRKLAIIVDSRVRSAPIVNGAIRGGRVSITMGGNDPKRLERERDELAQVLAVGALPAPLREASVRTVD